MKRKEYYLIGRIILLMGYVFLMLNAIFDEWMPLFDEGKKTKGLFAILNCWTILIPAGFLLIGIAARRKSGIVCAVAAILCSAWSCFNMFVPTDGGAVEDAMEKIFGLFSGTILYLVFAVLSVGIMAIAAIRAFTNRRWKIFSVVTGIVTLLLCLFYIVSFVGSEDTGKLLEPVRNAVFSWRNTDGVEIGDDIMAIARGVYIGLTCLAAVCMITESIGSRWEDEAKR